MTPLLAQRTRPDRGFERLYRRHVGDVYRYALAVMRNEPDAEDVTQTTFMNALRAFQRGERPEKPQNWLIAIAHNVCRQRFRQSARRPTEVAFDDDIGGQLVEPDDDTPSGEDIRRALGHLGFNQRAALVMRELEGRSYAEIGEILELSPSAVETLIFRARRALREQLETSLTCGEAELAISRQLDGRVPRKERGILRAHLRECDECARFARRQRAQRGALQSLAAIPLPPSLATLFGGGGAAAAGGGIAVKAAAVGATAMFATGVGYEGAKHRVWRASAPSAAAVKHHRQQPARPVPVPSAVSAPAVPQAVTDQKPFRAVAPQIQPRHRVRGHHRKGLLGKREHGRDGARDHEISPLPPSRERKHQLRLKHNRVGRDNGRHRGQGVVEENVRQASRHEKPAHRRGHGPPSGQHHGRRNFKARL